MTSHGGADRPGTSAQWPAWYGPLGFVAAITVVILVATVISAVRVATGGDLRSSPPALGVMSTLVQDLGLVGAAVVLARLLGRPTLGDFGLRPTPALATVTGLLVAAAGYYAFALVYAAILRPKGEQDVLEVLGTDESTMFLLATAFIVVVVAPVCEEVFFRGFFYRALRNRLSVAASAAIGGLVFGAIHYSGPNTLSLLPLLAVLGLVFCLLYEYTGSLYPAIALHAFNNAVALGATASSPSAPAVAAGAGVTTIAACAAMAGLQSRRRRIAPPLGFTG